MPFKSVYSRSTNGVAGTCFPFRRDKTRLSEQSGLKQNQCLIQSRSTKKSVIVFSIDLSKIAYNNRAGHITSSNLLFHRIWSVK